MEASETIGKPAKRTYKKHKKEGVISIIHFPNTKIKPTVIEGIKLYPLYVRITVKKQVTTIKSILKGYFSEHWKLTSKNSDSISAIELEKRIITDLIKTCTPFSREDFHISEITQFHSLLNERVDFINTQLYLSWIQDFLIEFAEKNKINPQLFLSVIKLDMGTVYSVISAFKNLVPVLEIMDNRPNHIIELILTILLNDNGLYEEIINTKTINNVQANTLLLHFFEKDKKSPIIFPEP